MKKQILGISLITLTYQFSSAYTNVKDIEINCSIKANVAQVSNVKYNPGKPASGRFDGIPSSVGFKAHLENISSSSGCEILVSKYKIYLGNLVASAGYPAGQASDVELAYQLQGKAIDLNLKQYIGYKINDKYLPLFPEIHKESLDLSFKDGLISGVVSLDFDLNWVYSVTPIENMTDNQKLSLAEKVSQFVLAKNSSVFNSVAINSDYHSLLLKLEPKTENLKRTYALLIWKIFNEYKLASQYTGHFLKFHVGGEGSYYGEPLALALNKISHLPDSFSSAEIIQLITDFPTWILAGYSGKDCLNFSTAELEAALENLLVKLPVMTVAEKYYLKDPMTQIEGKVRFISSCVDNKVSEKAKSLALIILKNIK